ncbi:MAG TPA: MFS transporter [Geodermatophilus sp.]|nr:MFS transporter [Geodermatophilus sp.]
MSTPGRPPAGDAGRNDPAHGGPHNPAHAGPDALTPVDPVEGGGPVEEPVPLPPQPRRGWAIDTTPLRNPGYRSLFWGVAATMLGQQMTLVAVPYQVYALTGSSFMVGVTSVVALVPLIVFGLLGGAIADSMDRRRLMLVTAIGSAATSAALAGQALLPGGGNLVLLWVLTALVSGLTAVNQPTRSAVIPALVGPAGVPAANALAMTVRQVGVIAGPLLAGVLIAVGNLFVTYAVDALGFLVAALLLRGLPALPPGRDAGPLRLGAAIRGVGEGFAFLRTQPVLLMTFVVDVIAMLFAWPQAVFPELSQGRYADSPNSLGWLFAGISIGALVMGLTSGWVSRVDRQGAVVLAAIVVWGIAIVGFGFAPTLWLAVLCLAVAGAGDMVSAVLRSSMLQLAAPEQMRGRMQGVFIVVVTGGPRLGDLRAGAVASAAGVTTAMVSGGVIIVVAMVVVALVVPSFWTFRASRSTQPTHRAGEN